VTDERAELAQYAAVLRAEEEKRDTFLHPPRHSLKRKCPKTKSFIKKSYFLEAKPENRLSKQSVRANAIVS